MPTGPELRDKAVAAIIEEACRRDLSGWSASPANVH
jgi:hypothetical protein